MKTHAPIMFAFILALSGCDWSVLKELDSIVNNQFPPLNYSQIQQAAIDDSSRNLAALLEPDVLLNVPTSTIKESFAAAVREAKDPNISVLAYDITPENQGFKFSVQIESKIKNPAGTFRATVSGWAVATLSDNNASIRPLLRSAKIDSVKMNDWFVGIDAIKGLVNGTLQRYIDNVNGSIKPLTYKLDPAATGLSGEPIVVQVSDSKSVTLPGVILTGTSLLIDETGLHILGAFDGAAQSAQPTGATHDFSQYRDAFWAKAQPVRSGTQRADGGIFVSDRIISNIFDQVLPKVNIAQAQQVALENLLESLRTVGQVFFGAYVRPDTASEILSSTVSNAIKNTTETTFGPPTVSFGEQIAVVDVSMSGVVRDANLKYKARLKIGLLLAPYNGQLYYRAIVGGIELESVQHEGGVIRPEPFIGSMNRLAAQILPHANALLDNTPIVIKPPKLDAMAVTGSKSVTVNPASLAPPEIGNILGIPRITRNGIYVMMIEAADVPAAAQNSLDVDLAAAQSVLSNPLILPEEPVLPDIVDQAFKERWEGELPSLPTDGKVSIVAAISIPWLVKKIDATLRNNNVSATSNIDSGNVLFDTGKISMAADLKPNCAADKQCSRNGCSLASCSRNACDYDCRRCVLGLCADEPICKTAETACNLREEAARGACNAKATKDKAQCDIEEEAKLGSCKLQREAEKLGCNLVNETIRGIKNIDGIGYVNGSVTASGLMRVSNPSIIYQSSNATLTLSVAVSGDFVINGSIHFVPYDIGHLLVCPTPGSVPLKVSVNIPERRVVMNALVSGTEEEAQVKLKALFNPIMVTGTISPPPSIALISQNPQILVTCSPVLVGALASASITGGVTAFTGQDIIGAIEKAVPDNQDDAASALRMFATGQVEQKQDIPAIEVAIPSIPIQAGNVSLTLTPHWKNNQILFSQ